MLPIDHQSSGSCVSLVKSHAQNFLMYFFILHLLLCIGGVEDVLPHLGLTIRVEAKGARL